LSGAAGVSEFKTRIYVTRWASASRTMSTPVLIIGIAAILVAESVAK
jgi:hypothetical protein